MGASVFMRVVSTPSFDPYIAGGLIASGLAGVITLWVRASRARAQVSTDHLHVQENKSQGGWIKELEKKLLEETILRHQAEAAERKAREQHLLDMLEIGEHKAEIVALTKKVQQLERRMTMISELLIIERPDLATVADLLRASSFVPGDFPPR